MRQLIFGLLIFCTTLGYSKTLAEDLEQLNVATISAEIFALNCIMEAQKAKVITTNCYKAKSLVEQADKGIRELVDFLSTDASFEEAQFYKVLKQIKEYRSRLRKVRANLETAKKVTGDNNWEQ